VSSSRTTLDSALTAGCAVRFAAAASLFGTALVVFVACADDSDPASPSSTEDGGTVIPTSDASPVSDADDGVDDAGADAHADAGRRICSDDGFCHSVVPKGQDLHGVWGDEDGIVWAISLQNDVLRWDGTSWTVHHHSDVSLAAIWGSGRTDVWIVTASGLLHGEGATSASLVFAPVPDLPGASTLPLKSIWGTGPNDIWVVGGVEPPMTPAGRVLHYGSDGEGGARWTSDDTSPAGVGFRAVWGSATSGVWVHGLEDVSGRTRARLLRRVPGAATWATIDLPEDPAGGPVPFAGEIAAAALSSDTTVWLSGKTSAARSALWRGTSTDGASFAWEFVTPAPYDRVINAFWGTGMNDTWAVGEWGLVARFDGSTLEQAAIRVTDNPIGKTIRAIWGRNKDDFWVVGDEVALHKTSAGKP